MRTLILTIIVAACAAADTIPPLLQGPWVRALRIDPVTQRTTPGRGAVLAVASTTAVSVRGVEYPVSTVRRTVKGDTVTTTITLSNHPAIFVIEDVLGQEGIAPRLTTIGKGEIIDISQLTLDGGVAK